MNWNDRRLLKGIAFEVARLSGLTRGLFTIDGSNSLMISNDVIVDGTISSFNMPQSPYVKIHHFKNITELQSMNGNILLIESGTVKINGFTLTNGIPYEIESTSNLSSSNCSGYIYEFTSPISELPSPTPLEFTQTSSSSEIILTKSLLSEAKAITLQFVEITLSDSNLSISSIKLNDQELNINGSNSISEENSTGPLVVNINGEITEEFTITVKCVYA